MGEKKRKIDYKELIKRDLNVAIVTVLGFAFGASGVVQNSVEYFVISVGVGTPIWVGGLIYLIRDVEN